MNITVTQEAQAWYEDEMGFSEGQGIRYLGKVYGDSPIHDNFSLAIEVAYPEHPIALVVENGIPYFIEETDAWFFEGYDFIVSYDEVLREPTYMYVPKDGSKPLRSVVDATTSPSKKDNY